MSKGKIFFSSCNYTYEDKKINLNSNNNYESIDENLDIIRWGTDNNYPSYLNNLLNTSQIHNSIIYLKIKMISSFGFISANYANDTLLFLKNNSGGTSNSVNIESIVKKIACDLVNMGGFALNIRWNKDRTKIREINYIPLECLRIQNPKNGNGYYISNNWTAKEVVKTYYPRFDEKNREKESTIYLFKEDRPTNFYYPIPEYHAAIELMEMNKKIIDYHNSTLDNQFSPHLLITQVGGNMTDDQKQEAVEVSIEEYQGTKKAALPMFAFVRTADEKMIIEAIPTNDTDTKYLQIWEHIRDGIIASHQLQDKRLVGVEIPGNLAGKNDIINSLEVLYVSYIADKQNIIQNCLNNFGRINSLPDKLILETYRSNLKPDIPINDLITLLSSTITNEQKVQILISKGYSRTEAISLVGSGVQENKTTTN